MHFFSTSHLRNKRHLLVVQIQSEDQAAVGLERMTDKPFLPKDLFYDDQHGYSSKADSFLGKVEIQSLWYHFYFILPIKLEIKIFAPFLNHFGLGK